MLKGLLLQQLYYSTVHDDFMWTLPTWNSGIFEKFNVWKTKMIKSHKFGKNISIDKFLIMSSDNIALIDFEINKKTQCSNAHVQLLSSNASIRQISAIISSTRKANFGEILYCVGI